MDETRPLNSQFPDASAYQAIREGGRGENDLEDHGGDGGGPMRRRQPKQPETSALEKKPSANRSSGIIEPPASELEQALDRMRTTEPLDPAEFERLRALRGLKAYRDDPHTTGFIRRKAKDAAIKPTQTAPPPPADDEDDFPA